MKKFHTFIFDLGGVVNDHDNKKLLSRLSMKCTDKTSEDDIFKKFRDVSYSTGERSVIEFFTMIKREFGYRDDWNTFNEDWCCHLSMRPGMLDYLAELKKTARIVFLSNTNLLHWTRLLELSDFKLADYEAFLSFDMGLVKPSRAIFEKVLQAADINPAGTLFVDDLRENVDQARACGLKAVLYQDQQQFEAFLNN